MMTRALEEPKKKRAGFPALVRDMGRVGGRKEWNCDERVSEL